MTNTKYNHKVRTFADGKMIYETSFDTAEKAYAEYVDIIENLKKYGAPNRSVTVVRYRDEMVMTMETVNK